MNGKITVVDGENKYIADCTEILQNSELGKAYFSDKQKATGMLEYALEKKELYVALNEQDECVGFVYCMPKGVFGSYPYLHIISVKEDCRGNVRRDNMGRYSRNDGYSEDGSSYGDGMSYARRGNSYGGGKEMMTEQLEEMMDTADGSSREAIRRCMEEIKRT